MGIKFLSRISTPILWLAILHAVLTCSEKCVSNEQEITWVNEVLNAFSFLHYHDLVKIFNTVELHYIDILGTPICVRLIQDILFKQVLIYMYCAVIVNN